MGLVAYLPWIAAPLMELCLAGILLRSGLRRQFPVFFLYLWFDLSASCLRLGLGRFAGASAFSFGVYWGSTLLTAMLGFLVIREVFQNAFRPYDSLREFGELLFRWATLLLVLAGVVSGVSSGATAGKHAETVIILARSVCMMQCGVTLLMLLFSSRVGLSMHNRGFGVALGFGLYASVELATVTMRSAFGPLADPGFELLRVLAYNIALAIWIGYMLVPERAQRSERIIERADDWNFTLTSIAHPEQHAPSLSLIESSVERVLRRAESPDSKVGR